MICVFVEKVYRKKGFNFGLDETAVNNLPSVSDLPIFLGGEID